VEGTIAIIGVGRMGEALLNGLLRSGWVVADQVIGTARREERGKTVADSYGVRVTTDNQAAIREADVVVLAVKPQSLPALLAEDGAAFSPEQTVISVVAGIPTSTIQDAIPGEVPVVRVMSNVCVQVDEAMSVVSAGTHASEEDLELAEKILEHVGKVIRLPEEHLDAVTALSGSGPAYIALLAESMIDAGILLGIPRDVSTDLILQTLLGTAKMLRDTGYHPVELREMVTSPGGTTIAAIRQLEQARVRAAFLNAIEAAKLRSEELAGST
jgi:pyrroline-5-carboxylate reductase